MTDDTSLSAEAILARLLKPENERQVSIWTLEPGAVASPLMVDDLLAAIEAVKTAPFLDDEPLLIAPDWSFLFGSDA